MSTVRRSLNATPDQVWAVLADGWLYPLWVVGASRMREVDDGWPGVGSRLHHSVGSWPLLIDDTTQVLEAHQGTMLRLQARAWPSGEAEVVIRLTADGAGTLVTIEEDVVTGPALLVPSAVRQPGLHWRNTEALRRLSYLAERRR